MPHIYDRVGLFGGGPEVSSRSDGHQHFRYVRFTQTKLNLRNGRATVSTKHHRQRHKNTSALVDGDRARVRVERYKPPQSKSNNEQAHPRQPILVRTAELRPTAIRGACRQRVRDWTVVRTPQGKLRHGAEQVDTGTEPSAENSNYRPRGVDAVCQSRLLACLVLGV